MYASMHTCMHVCTSAGLCICMYQYGEIDWAVHDRGGKERRAFSFAFAASCQPPIRISGSAHPHLSSTHPFN